MTPRPPSGNPEPLDDREHLLDDFTVSPRSLTELARAHGMTIPLLAEWAGAPVNRRMLAAIRDLSDARTDLIVSHARTEAAHALRRLAVESDSAETQRKACVDLLRLGIPVSPVRSRAGAKPAPAAADDGAPGADADHDTLRRVLEAYAERPPGEPEPDGSDGDAAPSENAA